MKIFNIKYKKNELFSEKQFISHYNIYNFYFFKLNNYLKKHNIIVKNNLELIDIINDFPENEKNIFCNFLGGYLNHHYFFKNINFNNNIIFGEIKKKILFYFNSLENLKNIIYKKFINYNGWFWIVINKNKIFNLFTKENINPLFPISLGGYNSFPLICIDFHEHSYYYDFLNDKKKYINIFFKYINWFEIENRLQNYYLNYNYNF